MKFTESQLEQAFIELLGKEGIPHLFGQAIQRVCIQTNANFYS